MRLGFVINLEMVLVVIHGGEIAATGDGRERAPAYSVRSLYATTVLAPVSTTETEKSRKFGSPSVCDRGVCLLSSTRDRGNETLYIWIWINAMWC